MLDDSAQGEIDDPRQRRQREGSVRRQTVSAFPEHIEQYRAHDPSLRLPRAEDVHAIFTSYASDSEVTRFVQWPTHRALADTHAFLAYVEAHNSFGLVYLAFARDDGRLLGTTGLTPLDADSALTGYVFAKAAWGHGFATVH